MILQALKEYYDRKSADPDSKIAPEGFERKNIPFVIVVDEDGKFINLEDTREDKKGKFFLLPKSEGRSGKKSYEKTFILWDHAGYLLGYPEEDEKSPKQHKTWLDMLEALPEELKRDKGVNAVIKFYENGGISAVKSFHNWEDCTKIKSCNMTFRLAGDSDPIPCREAVVDYVKNLKKDASSSENLERCLITGEQGVIQATHTQTPINKDAKSFVGFQVNSGYDSYGKKQGFNAPVSESAEFAYTTALKTLLKSPQRMKVGDTITVFWTQKRDDFEHMVPSLFDPPKDDPDRGSNAVRNLLTSVRSGVLPCDDKNNNFYILGLAQGGGSRIAVRFWHVATVEEMKQCFALHFEDLSIAHGSKEQGSLSLGRLLVSTASQGKSENILPNLGGDWMRTILAGLPYPKTLLQAVIRRNRAEQSVSYPRAALIKACINRQTRFNQSTNNSNKEEIKVSLDPENKNVGYLLGRLFAVFEKVQQVTHPGINATIRDRFYGAASGTPVTVFANLVRLNNHHLSSIKEIGKRIYYEKIIGDVMNGLDVFPKHLSITDQGIFALGYYHQKQDFYTKKTESK